MQKYLTNKLVAEYTTKAIWVPNRKNIFGNQEAQEVARSGT